MMEEKSEVKNLPWPVIIMIAMLALVIILGLILSPRSEGDKLWWVNLLGTTNNGVLLNPPVEIDAGNVRTADGVPWAALENETFKLVVINSGSCSDACQEMLFSARQLHVRLNRDYEDVERGFFATDLSSESAAEFIADLPDYTLLSKAGTTLLEDLRATNIPALSDGPIMVMIDPSNLAMMAYTQEHTGSEVLQDLEHLLELAR